VAIRWIRVEGLWLARWTVLWLALLAGTALAQAPERSPLPLPRPDPDRVHLPETSETATGATAAVTAGRMAAIIAQTTIEPTPEPTTRTTTGTRTATTTAIEAETAADAAAEATADPILETAAETAPEPRTETLAVDTAETSPHAPALSQYPVRRSAAAFARFTDAAQRAQRPPASAAADSGSAGQVTGGLCGVSTLEGRRLSRITSDVQGCGVAEPVSVTSVAGIRLSQPATLDCDTARAFDRWVRQVMQPAMGRSGGGVTQIRVAAHYTCRPRNNRAGARVSEHGRGRAIDIAGFRLANGQTVMVLSDWPRGPHAQALRQMHTDACGIFRTTLGPGSDGHHEDHFHFDMAARANNSTYCR